MVATQTIRFGTVDIAFDERVLTPRPWTLAQSEWAAALSPSLPAGPVLELGCGAGHIGLAAVALCKRQLVQIDASAVACELARDNARRAGLDAIVDVRKGDARDLSRVLAADERFALVIADPPYIPTGEIDRFPEDPRSAIDGGDDGTAVIQDFLRAAVTHLAPGGRVLLQTRGEAQAREAATVAGVSLVLTEVRSFGDDRAVALFAPAVSTV